MKIGTVNGQDYKGLGFHKEKDNSGYTIEFMTHGDCVESASVVAMVFIPTKHAKLLGKFLLDQNIKEETKTK